MEGLLDALKGNEILQGNSLKGQPLERVNVSEYLTCGKNSKRSGKTKR